MRRFPALLFVVAIAVALSAQQRPNAATSRERHIRVGVAIPLNHSKFVISPEWGRDQIVRDLKSHATAKKSPVTIEAVPLESYAKSDAIAEAADKHCDYVLLATIIDFSRGPGGVYVGPGGVERTTPTIGNADQQKQMGVEFMVIRPGHPDPVFDGQTSTPTDSPNTAARSDNTAFEDGAGQVAARVAAELRKLKTEIE